MASISLADLLSKVPATYEKTIQDVLRRFRSPIQEALRKECRVLLNPRTQEETGSGGVQVPVRIVPGYPTALAKITFEEEKNFLLLLSRYRPLFTSLATNLDSLGRATPVIARHPRGADLLAGREEAIPVISSLILDALAVLGPFDPIQKVLEIDSDVFGLYTPSPSPAENYPDDLAYSVELQAPGRGEIEVYWAVIGLVSELKGWDAADLALVVLIHEFAHAYTHLGADASGRRWTTHAFQRTDKFIKEGLAQYYTARVLAHLTHKSVGAKSVYEALLPLQHDMYRVHLPWVQNYTPEIIRRAMIECRTTEEHSFERFVVSLQEAAASLQASQ